MGVIGLWQIGETGPALLKAAALSSERDLEAWIERDPSLLERGLVIVGRQLRLEGGPVDLLALDRQGRWVIIEIKRERLRREAIAQALDYASCLEQLDPARLREQCNTYLQLRSESEMLDSLLEQRGRSLTGETDGREIVIYLVGTGFDPGLERMVGYLAERELSVRIVTFSAFHDVQGSLVLAREIHEGVGETAPGGLRRHAPSPGLDGVLALADRNGVGGIMRTLCDTARELGIYPRPYVKSIMFTPPGNRTRCLYVVWVDRRLNQPGVVKAWVSADGLQQFYGIKPEDLTAAFGPVDQFVMLDQAAAERLNDALRKLMPQKDSE